MAIPELWNVEKAAEVIGVTEGRVRQMLREGEMKGRKVNDRAWIMDPKEVERMAALEQKTGRPRTRR